MKDRCPREALLVPSDDSRNASTAREEIVACTRGESKSRGSRQSLIET